MTARVWFVGLFSVVVGCSSPGSNQSPDATNSDTGNTTDMSSPMDTAAVDVIEDSPLEELVEIPDATAQEIRTSIGPITLAPGEEITMCVIRRLPNTTPQYIRRLRATLGDSSHHLIFYRSNQTEERLAPFSCPGLSGIVDYQNFDAPLLIAQQHDTVLTMPDRVGMNLGANQMVRIEYHAINTTAAPVDVTGEVILDTIDRVGTITPADLLFWGNTQINIPPQSTDINAPSNQVHFFHQPWSGVRIFGITSHTHRLGRLSTINVATNATTDHTMAQDIREIHRSINWSEPPLTLFDPPLTFNPSEGLHLVCRYSNSSTNRVRFGESFYEEMCFLWAYYYPAPRGIQICAEGWFGSGNNDCFPP